MRTIKTVSVEIQIDDHDFEELSKYQWFWDGAHAFTTISGKRIFMHKLLCSGEVVDHKDLNGANNQKQNLRPATQSQNGANRGLMSHNTSGYKGVSLCSRTKGRWQASVTLNGKHYHAGVFSTPEMAAHAYNIAAKVAHGEFYRPNELPEGFKPTNEKITIPDFDSAPRKLIIDEIFN